MTIQTAIEKAIEGGWSSGSTIKSVAYYDVLGVKEIMLTFESFKDGQTYTWRRDLMAILLDPLFFQSLGKEMGWPEKPNGRGGFVDDIFVTHWHYKWFLLLEALRLGRTVENYFEGL